MGRETDCIRVYHTSPQCPLVRHGRAFWCICSWTLPFLGLFQGWGTQSWPHKESQGSAHVQCDRRTHGSTCLWRLVESPGSLEHYHQLIGCHRVAVKTQRAATQTRCKEKHWVVFTWSLWLPVLYRQCQGLGTGVKWA